MKSLYYYTASIFVFIFTSCEKENDPTSLSEENVNTIIEAEKNNTHIIEDGSQFVLDKKHFSFLPDLISFDQEGLYPEGVEFDFRRNHFLVSSLNFGDIGTVSFDGQYTTIIKDTILTSTLGLHIDNIRDRLYVAISDLSGNQAAIAGYDLTTKERVLYTDLTNLIPGPSLVNDMITDYLGNIYITDSFASAIYKVNSEGEASVFLNDPSLIPSAGIGLNGITFNPLGYLLVGSSGKDVLYKIPINNPSSFTILELGIGGTDGIQITSLNTIYAVAGGSKVYKLQSMDNFNTIQIVDSFTTSGESPTTIANVYFGTVYVLHSHLVDFFTGTQPPVKTFSIEKVPF